MEGYCSLARAAAWRRHTAGADRGRHPQPKPLLASDSKPNPDAEKKLSYPADATVVAQSPLAIMELVASPDGTTLAFESRSVLDRQENQADYEIFSVPADAAAATPRQLTHNQAYEAGLGWSQNSKTLYFSVPAGAGSAEHAYEHTQGRLYGLDISAN